MRHARTSQLIAAAGLAALLSAPAPLPAQGTGDGAPPSAAPALPEAELPGDQGPRLSDEMLPALPGEREAAREAQIEALFRDLADEGNPHWEATQNQILNQWRQSGSASTDLLLDRALQAMEQGDFETAKLHLDDLVRLAPDFAEGWNQRATVHFLEGRYGYSVADIERTLALEPRHFGAMAGLGIILDRLGNQKGALEVFRRVLEIHPHMPGAQKGVERLAPDVDGRPL